MVGGAGHSLLLFLSSDCDGCRPLWEGAADAASWGLSAGDRVIVVVADPAGAGDGAGPRLPKPEVPERVRAMAPPGVPVVYSSAAWHAYRVSGPPFFVLVDGNSARVAVEGIAWAKEQVVGHVAAALSPVDAG